MRKRSMNHKRMPGLHKRHGSTYPPHGHRNGMTLKETSAARPETVRTETLEEAVRKAIQELPVSDNAEGAVEKMLRANAILRNVPWPKPYDQTTHRLHLGDARDLSWIPDESVHLVVTSPPYWTLKDYEHTDGQLGDIQDYELFLRELDKVW